MAEREEPRVPGTRDHQADTERRFAALYQAYYRPILAYAVRRVAPGEDAADVAADVFTTAWRRIGELPEAPADRLWLYGVAQRVIAGRRRSARRLGHLTARLRAGYGSRPGQPGLRDAASDRVVAALDRLSPGEREALQLVLWEQLSHAEAAQVLGCSANAVTIRVHRAKTRLRGELSAAGLPGSWLSSSEQPGTAPPGSRPPGSRPPGTGAVPEPTPARLRTNRS